MADPAHVRIALQGAETLNRWRESNPDVKLELSGANLRRAQFARANLAGANLTDARLEWADFRWADLPGADLSRAYLSRADFHKADLAGALLRAADLSDANLEDANLRTTDLAKTVFSHTRLLNTDLSTSLSLNATEHPAPSILDYETIAKSGYLPSHFLKGCGVHDAAIQAAHSFDDAALAASLAKGGDLYSCFISYSSRDNTFVTRLHTDLQTSGVRCWFAPHHMRIGERIRDTIYGAIRIREKLLLVLSKDSVESEWVREEVEKAFAEEMDRKELVVFPIRLDDAVMATRMAWVEKIRIGRHIGDFRLWKRKTKYRVALDGLLEDLHRPVS